MAAWDTGQINLTGAGDPVRVGIGHVTANLFDTLGAQPLLGRAFTATEDVPGTNTVAMLGHGLWQRQFGGDPAHRSAARSTSTAGRTRSSA